VQQL